MKVNFDQERDIMRISFEDGGYDISKEVDEGIVVDMSQDKKIMAIEIFDVSEKVSPKGFSKIPVGISK